MAKKKKLPSYKDGGWIKKAVNPAHKGYCTPMSKSTCTPRRKALARRFKKGGDLHKAELGEQVANQQEQNDVMQKQQSMLTPQQTPPVEQGQVGNEFIHAMGSNPAVGTTIGGSQGANPQVSPVEMQTMAPNMLTSTGLQADPAANMQKVTGPTTQVQTQERYNPYKYLGLPYHAAMSGVWGDEIGRDKQRLKNAEGSGDAAGVKTYKTQLVGDKMSVAGHAIAGAFNTASTVLGAWSKGVHDRRVAMDEQAMMRDMQRDRAEIKGPYRGDESELGGGTNAAFAKYGGELPISGYGGKLGYLEFGGPINNGSRPNVQTERGEVTNNTDQVFTEGGDKHSDPSGGNTRAYKPGTVIHSASIGMKVGDMVDAVSGLPGGEFAATKIMDKFKNPDKDISYADASKAFLTKDIDKNIMRLKKKTEKEEMYVDSPNETKVSQMTSKLNLGTLSVKLKEAAMERDMNLMATGPDGPLHKVSEELKQSGAYGAQVKNSMTQAKFGKKIKLPKAQFSWEVEKEKTDGVTITPPVNAPIQSYPYSTEKGTTIFSPQSVTNFKNLQWTKPDAPRASQSALGYRPGFNASPYRSNPNQGLTDLQGLGFDPTGYGKSWDNFAGEDVQDYLMNLDKKGSKDRDPYELTKGIYNEYLTTNQGKDFEGKSWEELGDADREKFFKDDKYGVRTYLLGKFLKAPAEKDAAPGDMKTSLPKANVLRGQAGRKSIYHEGLDPWQIGASMMDLFTPKQAVPYIENVGDKNALAATTRQRYTDIQPQLNRITRATMAQTRNQGGTPVEQARGAQAYSNAYEAANQVYGEKYNRDSAIQKQYEDQQANLMSRAGANKAQALDTLAQRTATRDWKDYALRRNAIGDIGSKLRQQRTEDRASALYQDMVRNYGYNPITEGTEFTGGSLPMIGYNQPGYGLSAKDRKVAEYDATGKLMGYKVYDYNDPSAVAPQKYGGKVKGKLPKKLPKRAK